MSFVENIILNSSECRILEFSSSESEESGKLQLIYFNDNGNYVASINSLDSAFSSTMRGDNNPTTHKLKPVWDELQKNNELHLIANIYNNSEASENIKIELNKTSSIWSYSHDKFKKAMLDAIDQDNIKDIILLTKWKEQSLRMRVATDYNDNLKIHVPDFFKALEIATENKKGVPTKLLVRHKYYDLKEALDVESKARCDEELRDLWRHTGFEWLP